MLETDSPKLLVSVRDEVEATAAIAGGAQWIDLKEPSAGALGAVAPSVALRVVAGVGAKSTISAALGEMIHWAQDTSLLEISHIEVVKLGLAGCGQRPQWQRQWLEARGICQQHGKQLAGVVYADWDAADAPRPDTVIEFVSQAGGKFLLIDTFDKHDASSIEILGGREFARLVHLSRGCGLTTVVAGRLQLDDLPRLSGLPIDIVAVRGAVCRGNRMARLDVELVRAFSHRLATCLNARPLNSCLTSADQEFA